MQDPKNRQKFTIWAPSHNFCQAISSQLRHISTIGKILLNSNVSPTYPHNMVKFSLLAAEIVSLVWGSPANLNGFRVLAALLHGSLVVGVTQILRHWTEGTTYIQQPAITLALAHILVILIFDILGPQNIKRTKLWLRKPFLLSKNLLM